MMERDRYRPRPIQEKFDAGSQGGNTSGGETSLPETKKTSEERGKSTSQKHIQQLQKEVTPLQKQSSQTRTPNNPSHTHETQSVPEGNSPGQPREKAIGKGCPLKTATRASSRGRACLCRV